MTTVFRLVAIVVFLSISATIHAQTITKGKIVDAITK